MSGQLQLRSIDVIECTNFALTWGYIIASCDMYMQLDVRTAQCAT
jgi:hypothetical protein